MTTHQEQIALDLAAIFTSSEYGRPARFVPGSGPVAETVILVNPERGMVPDAFGENPADVEEIHALTAVVGSPVYGDKFETTDTDEVFTVIRKARKSIGRVVLFCTSNARAALG